MSELTPEIADQVVEAANAGAEEAADALGRALDREFSVTVAEASTFDPAAAPEGFDAGGLAVVLEFSGTGCVMFLPASTGLTPDWVPSPDPTGESKLATLAQELSMLLVPETLMADQFSAAWVESGTEALARGEVAAGAAMVPVELTSGEQQGTLWMLWPLSSPGEVLPPAIATEEPAPQATPEPTAPPAPPEEAAAPRIFDYSQLPPYSRSLLRVEVPLQVLLAEKRQKVEQIMALGPGSIITFDRPCDGPLEVCIGERQVALGEAVKVGEKFGVKIVEMLLPPESFQTVRKPA